jgi:hypothetical protein
MTVDICQELLRGGFTIAAAASAAAAGAWVGLKLFYRQKEFDLVRQRYLEGAIDIVAAQNEEAMGVWTHNWSRCLYLLMDFRNQGGAFDLAELQRGFLEFKATGFQVIPHNRLRYLVGSRIFWDVYEIAMLLATNANAKVSKEIPYLIHLKLSNNISASPQEIVQQAQDSIEKLDKEIRKFAILTGELQMLATILEKQSMTFQRVETFRDRPEVRSAVERLQNSFAEELQQYGQNTHNSSTQPTP